VSIPSIQTISLIILISQRRWLEVRNG